MLRSLNKICDYVSLVIEGKNNQALGNLLSCMWPSKNRYTFLKVNRILNKSSNIGFPSLKRGSQKQLSVGQYPVQLLFPINSLRQNPPILSDIQYGYIHYFNFHSAPCTLNVYTFSCLDFDLVSYKEYYIFMSHGKYCLQLLIDYKHKNYLVKIST